MNPWWTDQQAGLFGGIAGGVGGLLGGIFGTLAGICAPRGKCKMLVVGLALFMIGAGIISLVVGVVALALQQPYGVYYPLLLIGVVCTTVFGVGLPVVLQRYREADNRRLEAEELRRS
jgi:MFS family permease